MIDSNWRYRLQMFSERHNRVVFSFSMPVWLTAILAVVLAMAVALFALFVMTSTPLRQYLPGYLDVNKRAVVTESAMRIDSLARESNLRTMYLENLRSILLDTQQSVDSIARYDSAVVRFNDSLMVASEREVAFNARYEERERFGLDAVMDNNQLSAVSFITVVKGKPIVPEEAEEVDVLAGTRLQLSREVPVLSPLEGTAVVVRYLIGDGYEVTLQCANEYVVILSHLSSVVVDEGKAVKAGSVIGHAGSEKYEDDRWISVRIWHKGKAVDPQSLMNF